MSCGRQRRHRRCRFRAAGTSSVAPEAMLARDYSLDIGSCISRSWELVKRNFWPVVGISLLIMIISAAINQIIGLASGPVFEESSSSAALAPAALSLFWGPRCWAGPFTRS